MLKLNVLALVRNAVSIEKVFVRNVMSAFKILLLRIYYVTLYIKKIHLAFAPIFYYKSKYY